MLPFPCVCCPVALYNYISFDWGHCFSCTTETHFQTTLMRDLGKSPWSVYCTVVCAIKITWSLKQCRFISSLKGPWNLGPVLCSCTENLSLSKAKSQIAQGLLSFLIVISPCPSPTQPTNQPAPPFRSSFCMTSHCLTCQFFTLLYTNRLLPSITIP